MGLERDPVPVYVGIGANLGEAAAAVQAAIAALAKEPEVELVAQSGLWGSKPVDASGPDYVNAVVLLHTCLTPLDLLARLQALERAAGRSRPYRNAPRTLDLDLLCYGAGSIDCAVLQVPHPRMEQRAFVLRPLAQIAPDRVRSTMLDAVASQSLWEILN